MPLTKAEKQRAYRERQKQSKGEEYFEKERKRVSQYYIPIEERSKKDQVKRQKKVKQYVQEHRQRKKRLQEQSEYVSIPSTSHTEQCSEISSSSDTAKTTQQLIVKLPLIDTKKRTRKRVSRAVSKSKREIERLQNENKKSQRKFKTVSKRYDRLAKKVSKNNEMQTSSNTITIEAQVHSEQRPSNTITVEAQVHREQTTSNNITAAAQVQIEKENLTQIDEDHTNSETEKDNVGQENKKHEGQKVTMTPRKRTYTELREEGISPSKIPKTVTDKLILANVLTEEMGTLYKKSNEVEKTVICNMLSSAKLKKYKLKNTLSKKTGIRSQRLVRRNEKVMGMTKRTRNEGKRTKLTDDIRTFLERDDNSRVLPGKNDKFKIQKGHEQKRVLNDSLMYLHMKYKAEKSSNVSFSTFCTMRPKHIALTKYLSRNKCLCQRHQNMALALKSMKTAGADVPTNPDEFIRNLGSTTVDIVLESLKDGQISLSQWKKTELTNGKKRTVIVEKMMEKEEFITLIKDQICEFQGHVDRVKTQYAAVRQLKENIPQDHVMLQMDFAENFSCVSADEVQSAYWNSSAVSLHPVVAYFRDDRNILNHKNFVYVSDDLGHNFGHVFTIMKNIISEIKEIVPDLKMVHYWTDSPSSQYRNKSAFYVISDHENIFGVPAIWNYFESGHGKGPCDGVGGTSKRIADMAIKQGKIIIQDASDYFQKVQLLHKSAVYRFVSAEEIETNRQEVAEFNKSLVPIKGTMQVHQAGSVLTGKIKTCVTSCYCQQCIEGNMHDFNEGNLLRKKETVTTQTLEHVEPIVDEQENNDIQVEENSKEDTSNEKHRG